MKTIQTFRLTLRPFLRQDEAAAVALLRHRQVMATYILPDLTEEEARALFSRFVKLSRAADRFVRAVCLENKLIGWLNDTGIEGDAIELGWVIHPDHWGKGYATEAVTAAIGQLRREGFGCVFGAVVIYDNAPSVPGKRACSRCTDPAGSAGDKSCFHGKLLSKLKMCCFIYRALCELPPGDLCRMHLHP